MTKRNKHSTASMFIIVIRAKNIGGYHQTAHNHPPGAETKPKLCNRPADAFPQPRGAHPGCLELRKPNGFGSYQETKAMHSELRPRVCGQYLKDDEGEYQQLICLGIVSDIVNLTNTEVSGPEVRTLALSPHEKTQTLTNMESAHPAMP